MKALAIATIVLAVCSTTSFGAKRKKLIEYGWYCPNTAYMREHVECSHGKGETGWD